MKKIGFVYLIVGVISIIGAVAAMFIIINLLNAVNVINSADASQLPPGTDVAALQESVKQLNTLIVAGSVWIIAVLLSGLFCVRSGIANIRTRKIKTVR